MNYNVSEKFIQDLLRDYSRAIVGKLCSQAEILEKDISLSKDQAINLLKQFNRELIYQSFRDMDGSLKAFQRGQTFIKCDIYNPTTNKNG